MQAEGYKLHTYMTVTHMIDGGTIGAEASLNKIFWSEMDVRIHELALDIVGPDAERMDGPFERWVDGFLFSLSGPIYAGTNEIQRNIIADRVLQLPRGALMRFAFTDDQTLFAEGLRDLLAKECTPAHVRAAWDDGAGHDAALWDHLARDGRVRHARARGRGRPRRHRGRSRPAAGGARARRRAGPRPRDRGGRRTCARRRRRRRSPPPSTVHRTSRTRTSRRHRARAGRSRCGPRTPRCHRVDGIDGGRRLFAVDGGAVEPLDYDEELAFDRGALAAAAYLVGLGERMIDVAAEYARQREQYGRPIGVNQAVKHLLADALLKVEFAKPAVYRAAWSVAEREPTRSRDVSMAKAFASDAAYRSSRSAMQVHGAIGYTWEADLQLWMKKAWALQRAWGDATFHRRRVADAVLAVDP